MTYMTPAHGSTYHQHIGERFLFCTRPCEKYYINKLLKYLYFRFGVGQNLYIYKQTLKAPANDWTAAVTDWYDEVTLFRNKDVQPFAFSTATGHYTQVVWSTTDKVRSPPPCETNIIQG